MLLSMLSEIPVWKHKLAITIKTFNKLINRVTRATELNA